MKLETWKPKTKFKLDSVNLKDALAVLIVILLVLGSFMLGKIANEYLYWKNTKEIYMAAVVKSPVDYSFLKPFRNWEVSNLEGIGATAAIALATEAEEGKNQIIFEINASKLLPIASLTKILIAYIVSKDYDLEQEITITQEVVDTKGDEAQFKVGEKFIVRELLYSMLIESSNDAAKALADIMGEKQFVDLMNSQAKEMGLNNTHFINPTGLDPDFSYKGHSYSTVYDLAVMIRYILEASEKDPKIAKFFEITKIAEHEISLANGVFHHRALNTNELLDEFPEMIGAKTGETPLAGKCLLVIMPRPKGDGYVITIILNSNNRFEEMKKIINWLHKAYKW
jgi:D-alanyl-D-alanine carboxypeptidase